ncbi:CapA family protein [Alkalicoccus daliensis]|uniref:Poly-gamma-glutamate synthesis protein (Capsule biosynthesis protein) n=1 Tax=Alkalicoccus daliensis TaxID=745820 RepID=A0A1H0I1B2_9BACI|nr:CapA family protein [Alkalicoccus daliensis]SDO25256.1 poly-gamma-glutamate synthesis protein (capsule biosynthesis protein) [Alkalicoccus daliensis]
MEQKFTFQERMKLWQIRHKKTALRDSIIAFAVLSIPLFGYSWFIPAEAPEESTREEEVEYRMSMVGDMMMGRHVRDAAEQSNENIDRVFNYVKPFFDDSDYVTGNFESPILDTNDPAVEEEMDDAELHNKDIHLYAEPDAVDALINVGFDSVSVANNHALDFGDLSLDNTLDVAGNKDIELLGIGDALNISEEETVEIEYGPEQGEERNEIDASRVKTFETDNGLTVGILGFTDVFVQGFSASDYVGGVFTSEYVGLTLLRERLQQAKLPEEEGGLGVDIMMIHVHWGDEYQVGYNETQENLGRYMTNYGADIIIGHHSHVLEPVTVMEGRDGHRSIIMNSLGNFVFDQGWSRTKESTIAQLDFLADGTKELSFVPMRLSESMPYETAGPLKPYHDFRIFRTLRKELDSDWWNVEDGRLKVDLDAAGVLEGVETTS